MFAAGYLEGYLTASRIYENYRNLHHYFTETMNVTLDEPMEWIHQQDGWVRSQCKNKQQQQENFIDNQHSSQFWEAVCLLLDQFDGVITGYQSHSRDSNGTIPQLSYDDFLFYHSNADLYDIIDSMDPSQGPSWSPGGEDPEVDAMVSSLIQYSTIKEDQKQLERTTLAAMKDENVLKKAADKLFTSIALSGKCSALVKVAADLSDIYMSHSTWDSYTAMLRVYKHYDFNLKSLSPAANKISFSSYPGELFSDDDFFIMSSGLVVLQTTNKIFNDELFEALTPHSVLSWQRVRAANFLADSGEQWVNILKKGNSGTYNNQYMVVDLKRFVPGEELRDGLLWVAEQVPGLVVGEDVTNTLALGYWPSYNVPYFPEIYNASGYPDFISKLEKYGQHFTATTHWLSHDAAPRAAIFRRDHASVTNLETMKRLMRSNNYKNDPLSEGRAIAAICGRGDIDSENPEARGCYDTKVTSYTLAFIEDMESEVVNGPTRDHGELPPFQWKQFEKAASKRKKKEAGDEDELLHLGQPGKFDFKFERMSPKDPKVMCDGFDPRKIVVS